MNAVKRPLSVAIVACLYIVVGTIGSVFHFKDLLAAPREGMAIEITELVALGCGVFMLLGKNWARWLALAWIVFHVILSAFHAVREFAVHCLICIAIAWLLFRPAAARYFHRAAGGVDGL